MDDLVLARMREQLLRGGVGPRHVRRTLRELREHRADLVRQLRSSGHEMQEANVEADRRLGDPEQFVAAVLARPELRAWSHRYPWLLFTVLPVLLLVTSGAAFALFFIGVITLGEQAYSQPQSLPAGWRLAAATLPTLVSWGAPLSAAGLTVLLALRRRVSNWWWPVVGIAFVALLSGAVNAALTLPQVPGGKGEMTVGMGFPANFDLSRSLFVAALTAVPYVILARRRRRNLVQFHDR